MSFSHASASNLVPLLARLVLGGAFIYAGWGKVFTYRTFEGDAAATLRAMGVEGGAAPTVRGDRAQPQQPSGEDAEAPAEPGNGGEDVSAADTSNRIMTAAWRPQEVGQDGLEGDLQDDAAEELEDAREEAQDAREEIQEDLEEEQEEAAQEARVAAASTAPLHQRSLYGVALTLRRSGFEGYEPLLAWVAALTELIGGTLILIGLFSRIWGLGLAIVMVVAFYTVTWEPFSADPSGFLGDTNNYNRFFAQCALFVLAFGIFLTGPGAISADRLLFKHHRHDDPDVDLT